MMKVKIKKNEEIKLKIKVVMKKINPRRKKKK